MDKRTAWVSWILILVISLGLGGINYGQAERINVLQRESNKKDFQIRTLGVRMAQNQKTMEKQKQEIDKLQQKINEQQKAIEEVQKDVNF